MILEHRLVRCKSYREEALKQPRINKLYIEDLDLSIAMFEQACINPSIQHGWVDSEEEGV